jgi:anti-anti-sigma factor
MPEQHMRIETTVTNGYQVLRVLEHLNSRSDLDQLRGAVEQALTRGNNRIAISFTDDSYLDSRAIGNLAKCLELVKEKQGRLAVVQPNPEIADFLRIVGFVKHVELCSTERELGREVQPD